MSKKFWIGVLAAALVISLGWGWYEYRMVGTYKIKEENHNRWALNDLTGHLDQIETDLAKGSVANSSTQKVFYLSQVSGKSSAALQDFARIPAEQSGLSYLDQFLVQLGDFSGVLTQKIAGGEEVSAEEEKMLGDMHQQLVPINQGLQDLILRVDTEKLVWTDSAPTIWQRWGFGRTKIAEAAADGSEAPAKSVRSGLDQLDAGLQKLPPYSYTGEYAARVVEKPLGLPAVAVTKEQAHVTAQDFIKKLGYTDAALEFGGESQGDLGGYISKYKDAHLEVSRQGGKVIYFRDQRPIGARTLNLDEAAQKAKMMMLALGWQLVLTSSEDFGSYVQFDFVIEEDGVRIYPDKVRLMIALDNGQVVGFDAQPYYTFHHQRTYPVAISLDQAAQKLRPDFQVTEKRLAVIPKSGNQEVYGYEFRGRHQDEEYLIYVNAATGAEEQIQRILKKPQGEFLQ